MNYDKIIVKNLKLEMRIGVHEHEKAMAQTVLIDLEIGVDRPSQGWSDDIAQTLSYEMVVNEIAELASTRHFHLVENLAEEIASLILRQDKASSALITIKKPDIISNSDYVGCQIFREKTAR